ncbi:MAG: UbiA family prenyltransferase [Thermoplasmata archaeon]
MKSLFKLIRPLNCVLASVSVLIVTIVLYGFDITTTQRIFKTVIGMGVVFLFTGAGNTLNDYFDREVDKINHPERPIPSGDIEPRNALIIAVMMFVVSGVLSFLLTFPYVQIIVFLSMALMVSYEVKLKNLGLSGNFVISWLTGSLFVFAGAIFNSWKLPLVLGILAFLTTFGREIAKDIEDIKGDINRRTFPKRVGIKNAKFVIALLVIGAVVLSPYPYLTSLFQGGYLVVVIIADIIFIYSIYLLGDVKKAQKTLKIAMMIALIAFLAGGIL